MMVDELILSVQEVAQDLHTCIETGFMGSTALLWWPLATEKDFELQRLERRFRELALSTAPLWNPEAQSAKLPPPSRPRRPVSEELQKEIIDTLRAASEPLQCDEIASRMKHPSPGSLAQSLAELVRRKVLVNKPQQGYWPTHSD